MPADVRKGSAFPYVSLPLSAAPPPTFAVNSGAVKMAAEPQKRIANTGKAEPFRTSGGEAASTVC